MGKRGLGQREQEPTRAGRRKAGAGCQVHEGGTTVAMKRLQREGSPKCAAWSANQGGLGSSLSVVLGEGEWEQQTVGQTRQSLRKCDGGKRGGSICPRKAQGTRLRPRARGSCRCGRLTRSGAVNGQAPDAWLVMPRRHQLPIGSRLTTCESCMLWADRGGHSTASEAGAWGRLPSYHPKGAEPRGAEALRHCTCAYMETQIGRLGLKMDCNASWRVLRGLADTR
jgi:hypothetical protein